MVEADFGVISAGSFSIFHNRYDSAQIGHQLLTGNAVKAFKRFNSQRRYVRPEPYIGSSSVRTHDRFVHAIQTGQISPCTKRPDDETDFTSCCCCRLRCDVYGCRCRTFRRGRRMQKLWLCGRVSAQNVQPHHYPPVSCECLFLPASVCEFRHRML